MNKQAQSLRYLARRRGADLAVLRLLVDKRTKQRDAYKAQRDELREATNELTDALLAAGDIDAFTPGWMRVVDALKAAQ